MDSFTSIIDLWPSPPELAKDIGEKTATVQKWRERNSIPGDSWAAVVAAAKKRKFRVSLELLASIPRGKRAA